MPMWLSILLPALSDNVKLVDESTGAVFVLFVFCSKHSIYRYSRGRAFLFGNTLFWKKLDAK